jgi:UDP-2,3-diacylglucosamine hydrolase
VPQIPAALLEAARAAPLIVAKPEWQVIDFVSDLHLQAARPANFAAWQNYLSHSTADALFILGDLFEVWVGDDLAQAGDGPQARFAIDCQGLLRAASQHIALYFIHGNRDFLLGAQYAADCGMALLADPTVLDFDGQRWLVSHGDALCLGDTQYQQFRQMVRSPAWQAEFMARPLAQRQQIARELREQSNTLKTSGVSYADVDSAAACACLHAAGASTLLHGHTHRPADHLLEADGPAALRRIVLSDWDAEAQPPRLEILRWQRGQAPHRLNLA